MNKQELQKIIDHADHAYYTSGKSVIEDNYYDKLKTELQKLNPNDPRLVSVGSEIKDNILQKRKHGIVMGSLDKASNKTEFDSWLRNQGLDGIEFHSSIKMDGASVSLEFREGRLVSAVTRGDGLIGEDITANALNFKNIPTVSYLNKNKLFNGYIRGELILESTDWLSVDPDQESNPRNLAVGISRRKDGSQSEYISFYPFRLFDLNGNPIGKTEKQMSDILSEMGFNPTLYHVGDKNHIWKWFEEIEEKRQSFNFWMDGVVVKVNDIELQLSGGESSNRPKFQIALKFEAEGEVTTLNTVTYQVGHTGAIVPVAHFEPVRIGGTTVCNANLCNWDNIELLDICIGDRISVIKAGDIIPRIMEVVESGINRIKIEIPNQCPCCGGKISHRENLDGDESAVIYCTNNECPAIVSGKIDKYLTSLDIKGIGINLIESLIKDMGVKDASDLYLLHNRRDELANIILSGKVRLGEKRADKFLTEIEKRRNLSLSDFLGSLGIFGLGKRRVVLIQKNLPGKLDKLEDWLSTDILLENAQEAGVKNMAKGINEQLKQQKEYIMKYIQNGIKIMNENNEPKLENENAQQYNICITGKLSKSRKVFQELIEATGHTFATAVTGNVTHLVVADPSSDSSKLKKARKNGTEVISEQQLLELIGLDPEVLNEFEDE